MDEIHEVFVHHSESASPVAIVHHKRMHNTDGIFAVAIDSMSRQSNIPFVKAKSLTWKIFPSHGQTCVTASSNPGVDDDDDENAGSVVLPSAIGYSRSPEHKWRGATSSSPPRAVNKSYPYRRVQAS
jgi:hypothetical protein